jgi:hypothetical protein
MAQEVNADGTPAPLAFVPAVGTKDCTDLMAWGVPSVLYSYIFKGNADPDKYPEEACPPWYHKTAQIDSIQVNTALTGTGYVAVGGDVSSNAGAHVLSNKKNIPFDMPHPNKKGWRLRHVCIEGPEIAVYCRGKVGDNGVIDLPDFWDGLVNPEDMTINLTPIGSWQELFVKEVQWGKKVVVRNNAGGPINADYYIVARRLDDDLIVEYEGESHTDYPGGNEGYSFSWENDNMERLVKEVVREKLDELEKGS